MAPPGELIETLCVGEGVEVLLCPEKVEAGGGAAQRLLFRGLKFPRNVERIGSPGGCLV